VVNRPSPSSLPPKQKLVRALTVPREEVRREKLGSSQTSLHYSHLQAVPGGKIPQKVDWAKGRGVLCKALSDHSSEDGGPRHGATETLPLSPEQN
jgi:hypothetical protein